MAKQGMTQTLIRFQRKLKEDISGIAELIPQTRSTPGASGVESLSTSLSLQPSRPTAISSSSHSIRMAPRDSPRTSAITLTSWVSVSPATHSAGSSSSDPTRASPTMAAAP